MNAKKFAWEHYFGLLGLALLFAGSYVGLFIAPPERFMGDVQRIMYVHVPTAWIAMLWFTVAFVIAIVSLWTGRRKWDAMLAGCLESAVVLTALIIVQGIVWGRATWWDGTDTWWSWDVRLTTTLVMCLLYAGVLALRTFVEDRERKASWTAIATIVAYVDVPLVYFCVRWWRSLHQVQSTPETVSSLMHLPLRLNSFALLALVIWMSARRARIELGRADLEGAPEPQRLPRVEEANHA